MGIRDAALCELLGIELPIMAAGMGDVSGAELVAAVSEAGGLGALGLGRGGPEEMRREIRRVRSLTDKPFAVQLGVKNLSFAYDDELPTRHVEFVEKLKREFDIPDPLRLPSPEDEAKVFPPTPQHLEQIVQVVLEEEVPVLVTFFGNPGPLVARAHDHDVKVISLVGTTRHARKCIDAGADVLLATGYDAGGHEGGVGTLALIPQITDVVKASGSDAVVMGAGGIMDGRGVAAAMALGAAGVSCGSIFLLSPEAETFRGYIPFAKDECPEPWYDEVIRRQLIEAVEEDTSQHACYSGGPLRSLKNAFKDAWLRPDAPEPLDQRHQPVLIRSFLRGAYEARRGEVFANAVGQGVGLLREIKPAGDVVRGLAAEAESVMSAMAGSPSGKSTG